MRLTINRWLTLMLFAVGATTKPLPLRAQESLVVEPAEGAPIRLGRGYNTLAGSLRGDALMDGAGELVAGGGQDTKYRLFEVQSLTQLREELNVSASASLDAISGGASAKAEYLYKRTFNRYSYFLAVNVRVVNSQLVIKQQSLTESAKSLLAKSPNKFGLTYGDNFVSAITTGGEFIAVVEIETKSEEERTQLKAQLQGRLGSFAGAADFSQALETVSKQNTTSVAILRKGGGGALPDGMALRDAALRFPQDVDPVTGKPVVFSLTTSDYGVVTNLPEDATLPDLSDGREKLQQLARAADAAITLRNEIHYIKSRPFEFAAVQLPDLEAKIAAIASRLSKIANLAKQVKKSPAIPIDVPDFADLLPLPSRRLSAAPPIKVMVQAELNVNTRTKFFGVSQAWVGNGFQIDCLGASFDPPVEGLRLRYKVRAEEWGNVFLGQRYFECSEGEGCVCASTARTHRINAVSMWLEGPLANYYSVYYQGRGANLPAPGQVGDSRVAKDGEEIGNAPALFTHFRAWVAAK